MNNVYIHVCTCVCVHVHVCTCFCMCMCVLFCVHVDMLIGICEYRSMSTCTYTHAHMYGHTVRSYTCSYVHACVYGYIYMHPCACVCVCVRACVCVYNFHQRRPLCIYTSIFTVYYNHMTYTILTMATFQPQPTSYNKWTNKANRMSSHLTQC